MDKVKKELLKLFDSEIFNIIKKIGRIEVELEKLLEEVIDNEKEIRNKKKIIEQMINNILEEEE